MTTITQLTDTVTTGVKRVVPDPVLWKAYDQTLATAKRVEAALMEHRRWVVALKRPQPNKGKAAKLISKMWRRTYLCEPNGRGGCSRCGAQLGELIR